MRYILRIVRDTTFSVTIETVELHIFNEKAVNLLIKGGIQIEIECDFKRF